MSRTIFANRRQIELWSLTENYGHWLHQFHEDLRVLWPAQSVKNKCQKRCRSVLHRFHEDFRVFWPAQRIKNDAKVFHIVTVDRDRVSFSRKNGLLKAIDVVNSSSCPVTLPADTNLSMVLEKTHANLPTPKKIDFTEKAFNEIPQFKVGCVCQFKRDHDQTCIQFCFRFYCKFYCGFCCKFYCRLDCGLLSVAISRKIRLLII